MATVKRILEAVKKNQKFPAQAAPVAKGLVKKLPGSFEDQKRKLMQSVAARKRVAPARPAVPAGRTVSDAIKGAAKMAVPKAVKKGVIPNKFQGGLDDYTKRLKKVPVSKRKTIE